MPVWSRSGRELFYVSPDDVVMGVTVDATASWSNTKPVSIISGPYLFPPAGNGRTFDVAPDGRFLMVKPVNGTAKSPQSIVLVQNWSEEVKRLVPTP
jgi:hypothetical protein